MNMLPSVSLQIWPDPNESPTLCYFPDFVPFTNITTTINPERVLPTTQQEVKGLNQKVSPSCHPWLDILDIFPWRTAWFAICIVWLWQKRRDVEMVNGERVGKESLFAAGGREGGKTRRREEKHRWRERVKRCRWEPEMIRAPPPPLSLSNRKRLCNAGSLLTGMSKHPQIAIEGREDRLAHTH